MKHSTYNVNVQCAVPSRADLSVCGDSCAHARTARTRRAHTRCEYAEEYCCRSQACSKPASDQLRVYGTETLPCYGYKSALISLRFCVCVRMGVKTFRVRARVWVCGHDGGHERACAFERWRCLRRACSRASVTACVCVRACVPVPVSARVRIACCARVCAPSRYVASCRSGAWHHAEAAHGIMPIRLALA